MGTMPPQELLKKWQLEKVTVEMAIGHLIQSLVKLYKTVEKLSISIYNLRADVDSLIAHTGMSPRSIGKRKPPKKG
jgi:hypothetical protein